MTRPKIVVVLGPTSSGKSALAVRLARRFNGEIVSADSRQVYRGLDLGSGKITKKQMRGVPHHLLDVASPRRTFTVADYQKLGRRALADIWRRGKLPVVCGGSGFYLDALLSHQSLPPAPPNPNLRHKLSRLTTAELFRNLQKLDPRRARNIDAKNPRRLVRALEIVAALGRVPRTEKRPSPFLVFKLGLNPPADTLKTKIRRRLRARLRQGLIAEVQRLRRAGLSWRRLENFGLEYRSVARHLQSQTSRAEMVAELEQTIWQYARRQMIWYKRDKNILWFSSPAKAEKYLQKKLS